MMIGEDQVALRLLVAAALGALVGIERERHDQPAGLRTHMILAIGAALAMAISINLAGQFRGFGTTGDPARIAAQVVSGIGFLGAGAILRYGTSVKGLTTATSLWTIAMIGLGAGAGHFTSSIAATLLLLVVLIIVNEIEHRFIHTQVSIVISVQAEDNPALIPSFRDAMHALDNRVHTTRLYKNLEQNQVTLEAVVKTLEGYRVEDVMAALATLPGVRSYRIE